MMRLFFLALFTICSVYISTAQLYMPREVENAYKAGTRSMDGNPGKNYWQNRGRYNITVTATPPNRTVQGREEITYINNSPNALRGLVFRIIVNIHKPGAPRLGGVPADYLNDGVHIDSFLVNGQWVAWDDNSNYFTVQPVRLPQPLKSHDSVHLTLRWHYEASLLSNREGMIDSTTYFLAYCYPRVSVYDDYEGWDQTAFNDALEFYSDFNDYTLQVQVPKNYLVWATGTLQNPEEVLQPAAAARYIQSLNSDATVHVAAQKDLLAKNVTAQRDMNTWKFTAANVPDVALGLSDHFVWDAGSVVVDRVSGRRASVQAAYNDTAQDFHYMIGFGRKALDWLSNQWPGIPYPYAKTTIFQGYAGMEYPMMANDETYADTSFSKFVAMHEIAHTYMPFYMGINETRHGFMDEGWATTLELLFNRDDMGVQKAEDFYKQFRVTSWAHDPSADEDLPIITPGPNLNGNGLGNNEYGKPSLGYLAMKDLLGDALFKKCLLAYVNRWNGKHPIPWDFFYTFNNVSGKDLNWFWNNWFFSHYYIDLAVQGVSAAQDVVNKSSGYNVSIRNIGGMAAPFDLAITFSDGSQQLVHQTPGVWQATEKLTNVFVSTAKSVKSIQIVGGIFMDADESNNKWEQK